MSSVARLHLPPESLCRRLAALFERQPNVYHSALTLAQVGGRLSSRTRLSELRRAPYFMNIKNRVTRRKLADGRIVLESEYGYFPDRSTADIAASGTPTRTTARQLQLLEV